MASINDSELHRGRATLSIPGGLTETVEVRLWKVERVVERPVIGGSAPPRIDVLGVQGIVLSALHPITMMELSGAARVYLEYGDEKWRVSFGSSGSAQFKAWKES